MDQIKLEQLKQSDLRHILLQFFHKHSSFQNGDVHLHFQNQNYQNSSNNAEDWGNDDNDW